ncbi:MAG TPA: hypothetical protein VM183_15520 [Burkholderiales bacterium]|nr:hypothetical protein [Burkholderiales bacterium]
MKALALLLAAGLAACSTVPAPFEEHLNGETAAEQDCARWYQALDDAIDEAKVRDAQDTRLTGFPYLRVDRFLASSRSQAATSESAMRVFAHRLLELDLEARAFELANLPTWRGSRKAALSRTSDCGRTLVALDLERAQAREQMREQAQVPDDYSMAARAVGLYPLTRFAFARGVQKWQAQTLEDFARPSTGGASRVRFEPPSQPGLTRSAVAGMLERARFDPLGQPVFTQREIELLAATYAPSLELSIAADYDRFGELRWRRGAATPEVNAAEPVVYVQRAYTRYGERTLLQLVYTLWFPERPKEGRIDLLAGRLDGLVWRVTLAPDGEPLLYDSIHPCGCYHQFFPTPRARLRPPPEPLDEWAFVPAVLPRVGAHERPLLSVDTGTHYIRDVKLVHGIDSLVHYSLRPYDELRSLPALEGGFRSVFGPDGLVAGTARAERFLFWPMGIASAGAMRQWGRQASAFIGRRHFDDADLIERRFDVQGVERQGIER